MENCNENSSFSSLLNEREHSSSTFASDQTLNSSIFPQLCNQKVEYPRSDVYPGSSSGRSTVSSSRISESESSHLSQQNQHQHEQQQQQEQQQEQEQQQNQREQFASYPEIRRWRSINEILHLDLRGNEMIQGLWKDLVMKLYDEVMESERNKRIDFRHSYWDYSVIHANDSIDLEIVKEFVSMLTREGLSGVSAMKKRPGENKLDAAEIIMNGSTKVFVLLSPTLNLPGLHREFYQDVILRKFTDASWKRRLIPLQPSFNYLVKYKNKYPLCNPLRLPLGLNTVTEISIGDASMMIEEIREILTLDRQILIMEKRRDELNILEKRLMKIRQGQLSQLKRGIEKLQRQLGEDQDPSDHLHLMLEQLTLHQDGSQEASAFDTLVNMRDCNQVQVGTAINFNFGQNPHQMD